MIFKKTSNCCSSFIILDILRSSLFCKILISMVDLDSSAIKIGNQGVTLFFQVSKLFVDGPKCGPIIFFLLPIPLSMY